jgi:hypothetical protein
VPVGRTRDALALGGFAGTLPAAALVVRIAAAADIAALRLQRPRARGLFDLEVADLELLHRVRRGERGEFAGGDRPVPHGHAAIVMTNTARRNVAAWRRGRRLILDRLRHDLFAPQLERLETHGRRLDAEATGIRRRRRAFGAAARLQRPFRLVGHLSDSNEFRFSHRPLSAARGPD